jgi:hypothetical protein
MGKRIALVWVVLWVAACVREHDDPGGAVDARASSLSSSSPSPAATFTFQIATPRSISPIALAIGAQNSLQIHSGSTVTRSGTGMGVVSNMGSDITQLHSDSTVGEVWSKLTVDLRDRVHVLGAIHASGLTQGANSRVDGGLDTITPRDPPTITKWTVKFPAATLASLSLGSGQTATRAPGRYGDFLLRAQSTLTLSAGIYYLESLELQPGGKLVLDQLAGPVTIYVRRTLTFRGQVTAANGTAPEFLLGYVGTSAVIVSSAFGGTLVAPGAPLTIMAISGGTSGAFFGRDVSLEDNAVLTYRPGQVLVTASPPTSLDACVASIVPSDTLTGRAKDLKYQEDIARLCTHLDSGVCEATLRARVKVDYFTSAARLVRGLGTAASYLAVIRDRERKLKALWGNETLACKIAKDDADGDLVPGSSDACPSTPLLTATFDNGCTDPATPDVSAIGTIDWSQFNLAIGADPRCNAVTKPKTPAPLGAWRFPPTPTVGKAVWFSANSDTTGCQMFYEVEVELTDGQGIRSTLLRVPQEDGNVTWIPRPAGIFQLVIRSTDAGTRGAWASYGVYTRQYRVRAVSAGAQMSEWSNWYAPGREPCVAAFCGDFQ